MYPYPTNSSGSKSSSTQICTIPGFLAGVDVISPNTGTALLTIYDSSNSQTSGKTILAEIEVDAGMPSCNHEYMNFVTAAHGIYAALSDNSNTSSFIIRFAVTG